MTIWSIESIEPFIDDDGSMSLAIVDGDGEFETVKSKDICNECIISKNLQPFLLELTNQVYWKLPGKIAINLAPKPEDLWKLEKRIVRYLAQYVWIQDDRAYDLLACWAILSYFRPSFHYIPLIILDGATVAGKSTLVSAMSKICYHGYRADNYSAAAITRMIKRFDSTICLDEAVDNISGDRGIELQNLIKSCVDEDGSYVRAVPKTRDEIEVVKTYTSMMISIKGADLAEDVINRGIRIQMMSKPPDVEVKNLRWADWKDPGDTSPASIRTDLYNLMWRFKYPIIDGRIDLATAIENTMHYLDTRLQNGEYLYGIEYGIAPAKKINNRQYDIATALMPIASICGCAKDVMQLIIAEETNYREAAANSMECQVFRAIVDCILQEAAEHTLSGWPVDRPTFADVTRRVTTRQIAQKLNENLLDQGNLRYNEQIETIRSTRAIKTLGLAYTMGRGAGGRASALDPTAPGFIDIFQRHLMEFDPENLVKFALSPAKRVN
ncbi:MAG: hypothetical protein LKJ94_05665 [Candidatus Methanomethylophilus sp.]|jgi:hypothetical protein|nr:hypothetical protein [Methanomethylophilus sp.]MCI2092509.1 hypothetical protein [Methanomethylophilus sp.]